MKQIKPRGLSLFFLLFVFLCNACGGLSEVPFQDLTSLQPQVVQVTPEDQSRHRAIDYIEITFSKAIDPLSVNEESIKVSDSAGKKNIVGRFEFLEENHIVRFISATPFPAGEALLKVTPQIYSTDFLPLNQKPGESPVGYEARFFVEGMESSGASPEHFLATPAKSEPPISLVLNEVFYDAVGKDTEGDLFVELKGDPFADIGGYQILFVRGDDGEILSSVVIPLGMSIPEDGYFVIADAVTGSSAQTHVFNADWVKNFDPPNGPDCIQLLNKEGGLLDALGYGTPLALLGENNLFCYETESAPDAISGESLSRLPDQQDSDNNAEDWEVLKQPTPGEE